METAMKEFLLNNKNMRDIKPLFAGIQKCKSGHSYGPFVRRQYLIHFCLSGKGTLVDPRGTHKIAKGEMFIIRPGEVTTYSADIDEPWEYFWLGFDGALSGVFSSGESVMKYPEVAAERIRVAIENNERSGHVYSSALHEIIFHLFPSGGESRDAASMIKQYISYNYMNDISVEQMAQVFGFERSYLYRVFKAKYGKGVKEYIIDVRMETARELLSEGYAVGVSARAVGYKDEFNFSKAFKKYYGAPPKSYKARGNIH